MARRSALDQRFAQFCRSGEPAALGEVFDGTARELLHVAVWLCGNRTDAEDLLQRTFLTAIETRARFDQEQCVLPWLMGLLATEARHLRREQARRVAASPPAASADPEAAAAARELDAAVRAAGDELGEPYRLVLHLHLQQGLNAKEIAARLQRPAGTVRTQLMRALELLRQRLPGGFVAGFAPLVLPEGAVLTMVRAAVMQAAKLATPVAAAGAAGVATTWTVTGSLTMSKKFAAVAAVALLLVSGAVAWVLRGDEGKPAVAPPTAVQGEVVAAASDAAAAEAPAQRREVAVADAAPAPTTGNLVVRVRWQQEAAPAAGVGVAVVPKLGYATLHERLGVTDAAGECRFDGIAPGEFSARAAFGGGEDFAIRAGNTTTVALLATRRTTLRGQVIDEFERPVAGADIWLSEESSWFRGYVVARSDAAGHFTIPAGNYHYLGARKAGYVASYWRSYHADPGNAATTVRELEFTLQLRGAAGTVRGRVVDALRQPIAGARVFVGDETVQQAPGLRGLNGEYEPRGVTVVTAADGSFALDTVRPGPTEVKAWAEGHAPATGGVLVTANATANLELMLPPPALLQGSVRDGDGKPVAGAVVQIGRSYEFLGASARSGTDGNYHLGDLAAGETMATAEHGEQKAATTVSLNANASTTWDPVLAAGRTLRGVVLDPDGKPLAGVYVRLQTWMSPDSPPGKLTDAEGRFDFANVPTAATQILTVSRGAAELTDVAVPAGVEEVVIQLQETDMPTASLRLRLVDAAGRPVAAHVELNRVGASRNPVIQSDAATGIAVRKAMPPGTYELHVVNTELTLPLPSLLLQPHEAKDLGDIVVPTPARLILHARTADGAAVASGWLQVVSDTGQRCVTNPPQFVRGEVEVPVPPGSWTLIVSAAGKTPATVAIPLELQPGTTRELTVTLPRCCDVPLTVAPDAAVFAFGMTRVMVHTRDGRLQYCGGVFTQRDGSIASTLHLPPGDYIFTAIGQSNSRGSAEAAVPASGAATPVRIALHAAVR